MYFPYDADTTDNTTTIAALANSNRHSSDTIQSRSLNQKDYSNRKNTATTIAHSDNSIVHKCYKQEYNELQQKNKRWIITALACITLLILVLTSAAIWIINHRRRSLLFQSRYEHMQQLYLHNRESYERLLHNNNKMLEHLEQQLEQYKQADVSKSGKIYNEELYLQGENSVSQSQLDILKAQKTSIKQTDIYKAFYDCLENKQKPGQEQWLELEAALNRHCNGFIPRLEHIRPLSETEKRVSMLLKIDMRPMEIAIIMCKQRSTISSIRTRLCHKFGLDKLTSSSWDSFVRGV